MRCNSSIRWDLTQFVCCVAAFVVSAMPVPAFADYASCINNCIESRNTAVGICAATRDAGFANAGCETTKQTSRTTAHNEYLFCHEGFNITCVAEHAVCDQNYTDARAICVNNFEACQTNASAVAVTALIACGFSTVAYGLCALSVSLAYTAATTACIKSSETCISNAEVIRYGCKINANIRRDAGQSNCLAIRNGKYEQAEIAFRNCKAPFEEAYQSCVRTANDTEYFCLIDCPSD